MILDYQESKSEYLLKKKMMIFFKKREKNKIEILKRETKFRFSHQLKYDL
jgi:hypothetical protein